MLDLESYLQQFIPAALEEDLGSGDHTSLACIPATAQGRARLLVKDKGVVAGVALAERIFAAVDPTLVVKVLIEDGQAIQHGDVVLTVEGSSQSILKAERLVLNSMQRMSGIATLTRQFVEAVAGTTVQLLDTRKTTPTLRPLEKWAVRIGGGTNYRDGLYDRIMIKDNHVDFAGGIAPAIERVKAYLVAKQLPLEITLEVRNQAELLEALAVGGIQRIMLDNFKPQDLPAAVAAVAGRYEIEVSGGITLESICAYAQPGINFISVGALTHSYRSLDLSLKEY
jgi:nicotinate-nucleotide pyrophosphorylase (carboxylating)